MRRGPGRRRPASSSRIAISAVIAANSCAAAVASDQPIALKLGIVWLAKRSWRPAIDSLDPGLRAVSELRHSFASVEHDLRRYAAQISAPTLLLWGRRDPVIPHRVGVSLEREIPGARLVAFDSGHVPHTTDPDGVAAELVAFADAVYARRAPRVA